MTLYKVTSAPTVYNSVESSWFKLGDTAEPLDGSNEPDGDGDIRAYNLTDDPDRDDWHYIALSCLSPVEPVAPRNDVERVSVEAVRAVLALHMDQDQIDRVVGVIARVDTALLS